MIANQEKESLILEMINTAGEAWRQVPALLSNGMEALFKQIYQNLFNIVIRIEGIADNFRQEESSLTLPAAIASFKVVLRRTSIFANIGSERVIQNRRRL